MPKCNLCLTNDAVKIKSHIFPRWMYQIINKNSGNAQLFSLKSLDSRPSTSGEVERYLFCQNCENEVLGKIDHEMANLYKNKLAHFYENKNIVLHKVKVTRRDMHVLYSFFISILLRVAVTKRELGAQFYLENEEIQPIRQQILYFNPDYVDELRVLNIRRVKLICSTSSKKLKNELLIPPVFMDNIFYCCFLGVILSIDKSYIIKYKPVDYREEDLALRKKTLILEDITRLSAESKDLTCLI